MMQFGRFLILSNNCCKKLSLMQKYLLNRTIIDLLIFFMISRPSRPWSYGRVDLQLPVQLVPITTKVVSLNPAPGEVYSIQNYVIMFVSDLRHVSCFLWVLRFLPPIKLTAMI